MPAGVCVCVLVAELVRVHTGVLSCVVWSDCVGKMGMAPIDPFIECLLCAKECAQHFI